MTVKIYKDSDTACCPHCGSTDIEGHSVDINGHFANQDCSCNECEGEWADVYKLEKCYYVK